MLWLPVCRAAMLDGMTVLEIPVADGTTLPAYLPQPAAGPAPAARPAPFPPPPG